MGLSSLLHIDCTHKLECAPEEFAHSALFLAQHLGDLSISQAIDKTQLYHLSLKLRQTCDNGIHPRKLFSRERELFRRTLLVLVKSFGKGIQGHYRAALATPIV